MQMAVSRNRQYPSALFEKEHSDGMEGKTKDMEELLEWSIKLDVFGKRESVQQIYHLHPFVIR